MFDRRPPTQPQNPAPPCTHLPISSDSPSADISSPTMFASWLAWAAPTREARDLPTLPRGGLRSAQTLVLHGTVWYHTSQRWPEIYPHLFLSCLLLSFQGDDAPSFPGTKSNSFCATLNNMQTMDHRPFNKIQHNLKIQRASFKKFVGGIHMIFCPICISFRIWIWLNDLPPWHELLLECPSD